MKAYLEQAAQIIGERTPGEIAHDDAVVEALNQGHTIEEALNIAGEKFPDEAINWDKSNIDDIAVHYDYQKNHSFIMKKMRSGSTRKRH